MRIAELKKEAYEFKRDIVVGAENFRSGRTMAEKVVRYMEEKLRQKVCLALTLCLAKLPAVALCRRVHCPLSPRWPRRIVRACC